MIEKSSLEYPLSPNQQGLWSLEQRFPNRGLYNLSAAWRLPPDISFPTLRRAVERLCARHPALRTTFSDQGGIPFQVAHGNLPIDFREVRMENGDEANLRKILETQISRPLDLERGPPTRWVLISIPEQAPVLLLIVHHIVADAWTYTEMIVQLGMLYREETNGSSKPVPIPTRTYDRFIREQIDWRETPAGECQGLFWKETLSEQFPLLDLPTDRPHRVAPSFKTEYLPFAIPVALQKSMRSLARDANVRPLVLWLSAWFVFLHRMGGQSDLVTTLPVAGRGREYDGVLGFFVNNLPIRVQCLGEERFQTFSKHVADALETALAHQDWPFSLMTRGMDISTFSSLSQTGFAWQNFNRFGKRRSVLVTASGETGEIWHVGGMEWELIRHWHQSQEPDIQLHLMNLPNNQYGIWRYASDLFDRSTIERWSGHFVRLLEGIVAEPTARISQLPLLTEAERQRILVKWNDTAMPYPKDKCVHELFEDRAAKTPDAVALIFDEQGISYFDLNIRANRLAHWLRTLGVGPEALVGLFVERSVEMIVGLLAILKAGGAYVPLDPEYPKDRLAFMAEDAGLKVLLCHGATRDRLPECPARILDMDTEAAAIAGENPDNPAQLATSDNLAYVIYTSGSTGKPKGVMIEHEGLINLAMAQAHIFHVDPSSRVLQFASISFDAAIWEILMAFQAGAALCLADKASLLPGAALRDTLIRRAITHVTLPPSALTVLSTAEEIPALSTLITAGEAWPDCGGAGMDKESALLQCLRPNRNDGLRLHSGILRRGRNPIHRTPHRQHPNLHPGFESSTAPHRRFRRTLHRRRGGGAGLSESPRSYRRAIHSRSLRR